MIKTETNKALETITKCLFSQLLGGALEVEQLTVDFAAGYDKELESIFIGAIIVAPNGKSIGSLQFYNKKEGKVTISTTVCENGEFVPIPITKNTISSLLTFANMVYVFVLDGTDGGNEPKKVEAVGEDENSLTIRLTFENSHLDVGIYINKDGIERITIN